MNLEIYDNPIEQEFRFNLDEQADAIVKLKKQLTANPENSELKAHIKQLVLNLEKSTKEFFATNPNSMFYGRFYRELPILTHKEKISHKLTIEQEKLYLIKTALRRGKRISATKFDADEME